VWFKTRAGLVCVEGTVEVLADRWVRPAEGKCAGIFIYQASYQTTQHWFFRPSIKNHAIRKTYLACFPDTESATEEVRKCMQTIEKAIRDGELICDLSELGTAAAWCSAKFSILWK
jgi:hypothetical protein